MFAKSDHVELPVIGKHNMSDLGTTSDCQSIATSKESSTSAQSEIAQKFSLLRPKKQKELSQSFEMTTKMKGLLKGLRYISHIFDADNGKEQEMQIGFPTDVKHVAHIGWDGPSINSSPTWMNEYRPEPELSSSAPLSANRDANESNVKSSSLEDVHRIGAGIDGSLHRNMPELPKPSRRQPFLGAPSLLNSPTSRDKPKQSMRRQSTTGISISSPSRDATNEGSARPSRRSQKSGLSIDSSLQDQPADPKKSRRKKSKGLTGGGSTRPSRSKAQSTTTYTFSDPRSGSVCVLNRDVYLSSALEPLSLGDGEGEKGNH